MVGNARGGVCGRKGTSYAFFSGRRGTGTTARRRRLVGILVVVFRNSSVLLGVVACQALCHPCNITIGQRCVHVSFHCCDVLSSSSSYDCFLWFLLTSCLLGWPRSLSSVFFVANGCVSPVFVCLWRRRPVGDIRRVVSWSSCGCPRLVPVVFGYESLFSSRGCTGFGAESAASFNS